MTYSEFMQEIIDARGQWNIQEGEYYEVHHIIPKCLGGLPKYASKTSHNSNIIWLYPQEHFVAHKLLAEENPTDIRLTCAFIRMCYSKNADYVITPEEYAKAKKLQAEAARINLAGTNNPMYGKYNKGSLGKHWALSEETKQRISQANKGKKRSEEFRLKMSQDRKGKPCTNRYACAKRVRCIELQLDFDSMADAAKYFNKTKSAICDCLKKGHLATSCGYHWEYIMD
jgi:hypothetical protein